MLVGRWDCHQQTDSMLDKRKLRRQISYTTTRLGDWLEDLVQEKCESFE